MVSYPYSQDFIQLLQNFQSEKCDNYNFNILIINSFFALFFVSPSPVATFLTPFDSYLNALPNKQKGLWLLIEVVLEFNKPICWNQPNLTL